MQRYPSADMFPTGHAGFLGRERTHCVRDKSEREFKPRVVFSLADDPGGVCIHPGSCFHASSRDCCMMLFWSTHRSPDSTAGRPRRPARDCHDLPPTWHPCNCCISPSPVYDPIPNAHTSRGEAPKYPVKPNVNECLAFWNPGFLTSLMSSLPICGSGGRHRRLCEAEGRCADAFRRKRHGQLPRKSHGGPSQRGYTHGGLAQVSNQSNLRRRLSENEQQQGSQRMFGRLCFPGRSPMQPLSCPSYRAALMSGSKKRSAWRLPRWQTTCRRGQALHCTALDVFSPFDPAPAHCDLSSPSHIAPQPFWPARVIPFFIRHTAKRFGFPVWSVV